MRQPHKRILAALASLVVTLTMIGGGSQRACAQDATGPGGTQIFVTPYLWLPGINANIKTPLPRASSIDASVNLLSHLDGVPLLLSGEIRDGPIGFLGDVMHLPVGANITTRNVFYQGGNATLTTNVGTAMILYRALDVPGQFADFGVGFRAWGFGAKLTLNPGQLPAGGANQRAGWGDPLVGGRYHYDFGNGWGLTAYGDVGGFDLGAHTDWQVIGTVDYAPNPWLNLRLGYRSLNVAYEPSSGFNVGFNVHMKGPILAATFRF